MKQRAAKYSNARVEWNQSGINVKTREVDEEEGRKEGGRRKKKRK